MKHFLISILVLITSLTPAAAQLSVALTEQQISIDQSFAGARIIIYGAVTGLDEGEAPGDLIIIVRGPPEDVELRPKKQVAGLWLAGDPIVVRNAPSFYFAGATRALSDILPEAERAAREAGADYLNVTLATRTAANLDKIENNTDAPKLDLLRDAIVSARRAEELYIEQDDAVTFLEGGLFRAAIDFPANTPVGHYQASIYLAQDGEIVSHRTAPIYVEKVGLERQLFDLAQNRPLSYGLLCVVVSLFAGWIAAVVFRK